MGQFVLQSFKLGQFYAIVFILKLLLLSKKILEIISANRGGGGGTGSFLMEHMVTFR